MRSLQDTQAVERDLIGRLVINPELIDEYGIQRGWFTLPDSMVTLEAIDEVMRTGEKLSIPFLVAKLRDMTGGNDHLQRVVSWKSNAVPESQMPEKVSFLKREAMLREAQQKLTELQKQVAAGNFSPEQAATEINALTSDGAEGNDLDGHKASQQAIAWLVEAQKAAEEFGSLTGITTGIAELDNLTGGFQRGDLIIVGGQPSMGKTAFQISLTVPQLKAGYKVGLFSSDMPAYKVSTRIFANYSRFNLHHAKSLPTDQTEATMVSRGIAEGSKFLSQSKFRINDKGGINIAEIERQARQWHRLHGLDVLYIDYIQRIRHDNPRLEKREQVTDMAIRLKNLGKDLNIAVVALAQTSRATASRANKRPVIQDLAESAGLEREACLIMFPFRESVFDDKAPEDRGEIILAKHQDGPTGTVPVFWDKKSAAYRNAVNKWEMPDYV